ncbi:hypothetical protein AB0D10_16245 [Kitasatospora sp. NPDC048545]|uniref:hypothetical protein n=1 Tax=Kitasatospora sp. NPDC048545 TaxID=3157208 RepID=UPI0034039C50
MNRSVSQSPTRRLGALTAPLLALATLGLAAPAHAATAHATTAPSVTVVCDSGNSVWSCDAYAAGGSGNYSYSWTAVGNAGFYSGLTAPGAYGPCRTNLAAAVKVTVTDNGTGASVSRQEGFFCYAIAP